MAFGCSKYVIPWIKKLVSYLILYMYIMYTNDLSVFRGDGVVYHLDELTGALQVSHRLAVSSKDFPGIIIDV